MSTPKEQANERSRICAIMPQASSIHSADSPPTFCQRQKGAPFSCERKSGRSFTASAPCKLILTGEHFAVWGSGSICVPIEMRNSATVTATGKPGFALRRDWGWTDLSLPFGEVDARAHFLKGTYDTLCRIAGKPITGFEANIPITSNPKGIGNSSSVSAAFAAAALKSCGLKLSQKNLFDCAHAADLVAHGGSASGVDARTVTFGKPILFRKRFNPDKFSFRKIQVNMASDMSIILIDTFHKDKCTTKEQIAKFAASWGMDKAPSDCTEGERDLVVREYEPISRDLLLEFSQKKPSPARIGKLFLENQDLLSRHGVSTPAMDSFIQESVDSGFAWGGKLTGAGGVGGSIIILAKKAKAQDVFSMAYSRGFGPYEVEISRKGIAFE
ncbi:MAG TPA: hypothetical protein PLO51_05180 [Candidatus Micrarchaeota archaeon]|nr:hypothetical protein [Candidatus Micrarchaeota archaeon]